LAPRGRPDAKVVVLPNDRRRMTDDRFSGEVREWLKRSASKAGEELQRQ
jgi:hypothetical protein